MPEHKALYKWSLSDATNMGEDQLWQESHNKNCLCARAIESAISDNYADNRLNTDVAKEIIETYGFDRVNYVLANTVQRISARIDRMNDDPNSNFKANASVTIGNHFAVHGFTVYENEKGRSVLYPGQKGSDKNFYETFHPVTKEAREALNGYILDAYEQKLEQTEGQNQGEPTEEEPSDDEEPAFEQTM